MGVFTLLLALAVLNNVDYSQQSLNNFSIVIPPSKDQLWKENYVEFIRNTLKYNLMYTIVFHGRNSTLELINPLVHKNLTRMVVINHDTIEEIPMLRGIRHLHVIIMISPSDFLQFLEVNHYKLRLQHMLFFVSDQRLLLVRSEVPLVHQWINLKNAGNLFIVSYYRFRFII